MKLVHSSPDRTESVLDAARETGLVAWTDLRDTDCKAVKLVHSSPDRIESFLDAALGATADREEVFAGLEDPFDN